jgi:hypothetical protein
VKGSDLEHTQLTPGQFHAQTTRVNMGASFLDIGEYYQAVGAPGSMGSAFNTFFFIPRQEGTSNAFPVNNERFVTFGSGADEINDYRRASSHSRLRGARRFF